MSIKAKLLEFLNGIEDDETPEPVATGETIGEATAADDPGETPEPVGLGEDPSTEPEATPDAVDADADPTVDPTPTLPETAGYSDEERDGMNALAAENEALRAENAQLRNRVAELGGDAALGITEEVVEPAPADEGDEYDAEADFAAEEAEIARIKGDTPKKDE